MHIIAKVQSNFDGSFIIKNLPSGSYDLIVKASGYMINTEISKISIVENETLDVGVVKLTKGINTGSLSGRVVPTGSDVVVLAKKDGASEIHGIDIVGSQGGFKITDLEPSAYDLFVVGTHFKWEEINVEPNKEISNFTINIAEAEKYAPDQIIVTFQSDISEQIKLEIIERYKTRIMKIGSDYYILNIPDDKTVPEMVSIFNSIPEVGRAEINGYTSIN